MCWPYALLQHLLLSVYADSTVMTDDSSRLSQFLVWVCGCHHLCIQLDLSSSESDLPLEYHQHTNTLDFAMA